MAAGISTICLVGFSEGVEPRELKNLCRFMTGFEGAHIAFAGVGIPSTLFIKFETPELATSAMDILDGAPFDLDNPQFTLKAEWARREMEVRPHAPPPAGAQPPAPHYGKGGPPPAQPYGKGGGSYAGPPSQRGPPGGSEKLVTIVVFGLGEKGLQSYDLELFFQDRPGFVSLQMNERIDGMFVRFESAYLAEQALHEANGQNMGAEWARRNLDDDLNARHHGGSWQNQPNAAPPPYAGPPSRKGGGSTEHIVTICALGLAAKDISVDQMQEWFAQRPGFDRQQLNDRIGGLFVKFTSAQTAEQALSEANDMGYGAEWARRNLDDDLSARHAPPPSYHHGHQHGYGAPRSDYPPQAAWGEKSGKGGGPPKRMRSQGGEIDTITVRGVREKEHQHGNLQQWFAERPGYVALQMNEKIGAMFIKFSSKEAAERAYSDASDQNIGVEWAYRNLDL